MAKKQKASVRPGSDNRERWVQPPGMRGAFYAPDEEREVLAMVLGPDYAEMLRTGTVSAALRQCYREAVLVHELKVKLDARFAVSDDGG